MERKGRGFQYELLVVELLAARLLFGPETIELAVVPTILAVMALVTTFDEWYIVCSMGRRGRVRERVI